MTKPGAMLAAAGNAARSFSDMVPGVEIDTTELEQVAATFRATALTDATTRDVLTAAASELRARHRARGDGPHTRAVNVIGAISYVLYGDPADPGDPDEPLSDTDMLYRDTLTVLAHNLGLNVYLGMGAADLAAALTGWAGNAHPLLVADAVDYAGRPAHIQFQRQP